MKQFFTLFYILLVSIILSQRIAAQSVSITDSTQVTANPPTPAVQPSLPTAGTDTASFSWQDVEITVIDPDGASLQAQRQDTTNTFAVTLPELKKIVTTFEAGDRVAVTYTISGKTKTLNTIEVENRRKSKASRVWTLAGSAAGVLIFFRLLLRRKLRTLILGIDNRYSNSNFQIVMWFSTLIITYVAVNIMRGMVSVDFVGGVNIPSNLLLLSGFSALTFATAKGITESKNQQAIRQNLTTKQTATEPHFPTDLFQDDTGAVDMADFQMVVITLLAVVVYIFQVFDFLAVIELRKVVTLPDVDSTILATFGLGHGAYLAKKYVGGINS